MSAFQLISLSDSSALWELNPGAEILEGRQALRSAQRSLRGVLHGCVWGAHYRAQVPLSFVESGLREAAAAWWRSQARLAWTQFGATGPETAIVRIGNAGHPLGRRQRPFAGRYAGTLVLEGIGRHGDRVHGAPFILDHAIFGTLDTDNVLL